MAARTGRPSPTKPAGPWLASVAGVGSMVALAAMLIDLGPFHRLHNGDSLVAILVSLYQWQPFFWEQDRVGMLVPLLTTGIHHPLGNLLAQTWLTCSVTLAGFFALAWIAVGPRRWVPAGSLAAIAYLATVEEAWRFALLTNYGPGLMAVGAAVCLAGQRLTPARFLAGSLLLVLGAWVNTGAAFTVVPAIVLRGFLARTDADAPIPKSRSVIATALAVGAFFVSLLLSTTAPVRMNYGILPPGEWPACWAGLLANTYRDGLLAGVHLGALGVLAAAAALGAVRGDGAARRRVRAAFVPLAAAAVCLALFMGTVSWTKFQDLSARYMIPAVVALDVAVAGACVAAYFDRVPVWVRERVFARAALVLVAVVALLYFPPSLARVRADIDRTLGARTPEVLENGVTHVAGSYWTVWPTVFHANLVLYERGSDRKVWGLAHRASPTVDRWGRIPLADWRVAVIPEELRDSWTATVYRNYRLPPLRPIARLGIFTLCVPEVPAAR